MSKFYLLMLSFWCSLAVAQRPVITTGFNLPPGRNGLVYCGFELTPRVYTELYDTYRELIITIHVEGSTAQNLAGGFEYKYKYNGTVYNDNQVGQDVFQDIKISGCTFRVVLQGPEIGTKTISYNKGDYKVIARVKKDYRVSDVTVNVEALTSVSFNGTRGIEAKIQQLLNKKKDGEQYNSLIKKGDNLFNQGKFLEAKNIYKQAEKFAEGDTEWEKNFTKAEKKLNENAGSDNTKKQPSKPTDLKKETSSSDDDFWGKSDKKPAAPRKKSSEEETAEIMKSVQKQQDDFWNDKKVLDEKLKKQSDLRMQHYNDAQAVRDSRDELKKTSSLNKNYESVQALNADFDYKMSQINSQVNTLTENTKSEWNSRVDASFNKSDEAGINAGLKVIGAIVNDAKEKKEREYYREKLEKQKQQRLVEIANKRKEMLINLRMDLLGKFPDGTIPLSSHKTQSDVLYYFVYSYDQNTIKSQNPVLYVSNVFPIAKYQDGTWPFKTNIISEVDRLTPHKEILHGYYTSSEEATSMQTSFIDIFKKTGGSISIIRYKGKAATGDDSSDFWDNEQNGNKTKKEQPEITDQQQKKEKTNDDFWKN